MSSLLVTHQRGLSFAWAEAFLQLMGRAGAEAYPLVVTIDESQDGRPVEMAGIRESVDGALREMGLPSIDTVASTIFPVSLWNPEGRNDASELFRRYEQIWPRIEKCRLNKYGVYFRRLTAYESGDGQLTNQLQHLVGIYREGNHRRSALQAAVLDPTRDITGQRQRGFPCLQQVAFLPGDAGLRVTAFFGMQHAFTRLYGNLVGLWNLGRFMAKQFELPFAGVTNIAGVAQLGAKKRDLGDLEAELRLVHRVQS